MIAVVDQISAANQPSTVQPKNKVSRTIGIVWGWPRFTATKTGTKYSSSARANRSSMGFSFRRSGGDGKDAVSEGLLSSLFCMGGSLTDQGGIRFFMQERTVKGVRCLHA